MEGEEILYGSAASYPLIKCHDCGELSARFEARQGVSMGGVVYNYSIGKCCEYNYK